MNLPRTERLLLRRFVLEDAEFVVRLLNEPSFLKYIGDRGVRSLEEAHEYLRSGPLASYEKHGFGLYLVQLREQHTAIGMCGLLQRDTLPDVDLGFAFLPEYWRFGYALESAKATLDYARQELGLKRVVAVVSAENERSIRLLEKLGLVDQGQLQLAADDVVQLFAPPTL
jgi:RimJ/RimL family protein N-acetyltransferase